MRNFAPMKIYKKSVARIVILLFGILFLDACKGTKINTESPNNVVAIPKFESKASTINVPLTLQVKQLEALANRELDVILYKDDNPDDDHFAITVSRTGNVTITADNDQLIYSLPIHVYAMAKYELNLCDACPKIGKSKSTEFDITVKSKTSLALNNNWQVTSKTKTDYEWGKKPYIELGPISIPISKILEPILDKQLDNVSTILDKEIQKRVEIKSKVQKAWTDIQQPLLLDKDHDAWLAISPVEIKISPIQCRKNEINVKVGIRSYINTYTGMKPAVTVNEKLPDLIIDNKIGDDFEVFLSGEIPYDVATKYVKEQFVGKFFEFENGKYQINVKDAEIFGSPDAVVVRLDIDGRAGKGLFSKRIHGNVFLQGLPYYDEESQTIKVKNFGFNIKTKDILLKSASWVTKIGFMQKIQEKVQFPIKEKIEEARKMVQDGLNQNGRINNSVLLKGTIGTLVPQGIYLTPTSMKAVVYGKGNVSVVIDKL